MAEEPQNGSGAGAEGEPQTQNPEQLLEDWGRRAGRFLSAAAARAREEAEDIWAEAQSIRRGERE